MTHYDHHTNINELVLFLSHIFFDLEVAATSFIKSGFGSSPEAGKWYPLMI